MADEQSATRDSRMTFSSCFSALTGYEPMPWQESLYQAFVSGDFSRPVSLPTGLGKTSVIHIWLLALAAAPTRVPRRLVYVVNRRTIVDQATREAERLRKALMDTADRPAPLNPVVDALQRLCATPSESPLAISTLRGQFADNAEWLVDPSRAAIILGTVDMIGSRLLFSAYGRGFRSRPMHAAFLGQDTLVVHDEAHLEHAFQCLLESIREHQRQYPDFRPLQVVPLTATPRGDHTPIELSPADYRHEIVARRLNATKRIRLHEVDSDKKLETRITELALEHKDSNGAILVFLRRVEDVKRVSARLPTGSTLRLTGTLRGLERDQLVSTSIFQRFVPATARVNGVQPADGTVYLVCTSAGEVGVDISADHMICDLTPFDSMAQRFGRVNRYGDGEAWIDVVYPAEFDTDAPEDVSRERTLTLIRRLNGDGSPHAFSTIPLEDRRLAFSPVPDVLPVSSILFDTWALTTIRGELPGRPAVADWLHGVAAWQPPEAFVAWRQEVDIITDVLLETYPPAELLEDYPLKPHELLRDVASRVLGELKKLSDRHPEKQAWVISADDVRVLSLERLAGQDEAFLADKTVVLPPSAGGLRDGLLDAGSTAANDVSELWFEDDTKQQKRRERRFALDSSSEPPARMRLVRTIDTRPEAGDDAVVSAQDEQVPYLRYWHWYVLPRAADDDGSRFARQPVELSAHLNGAAAHAATIARGLGLPELESRAVTLAASWHDLGKRRLVWQRSIGNPEYTNTPPIALAKSGGRMRAIELGGYRHEFGSLLDVLRGHESPEFVSLSDDAKNLVLHLIAAHHGRARPHFPAAEAFDPENVEQFANDVARDIPDRFVLLQRRYGRWGLAYLESIVRAADALASGAGE